MKYGGRCENVHLQIGDYHLKSHMFAIDMGGCDIVLGAYWLRTLGPILMDFKELTMQFDQEGHQYKFQGITAGSPEVISSHCMEKLLKKIILVLSPKSMPYEQQRHPRSRKTSKPSFLQINWYFPLPKDSVLPMVFMIIPFPLYLEAFLPISVCIITTFPKKTKLRKWFRNSLMQALSALVRSPTLLLWSWS